MQTVNSVYKANRSGKLGEQEGGLGSSAASGPAGSSGQEPQGPEGWLRLYPCNLTLSDWPPGRQQALQSRIRASRPTLGDTRRSNPKTLPPAEFSVSSNTPTFQMGKPRPRETWRLTQDSDPGLQSGWSPHPTPCPPQPLSPNSWAHPKKPSLVVAPAPGSPNSPRPPQTLDTPPRSL